MKAQPNNFPHFKAKPDASSMLGGAALSFFPCPPFFFLQLFLIPFVVRSDVP